MAFLFAVGAAALVALKLVQDSEVHHIISVANSTLQPIVVVVENSRGKNQSIIEAGEFVQFTVLCNTPISIKVRKPEKTTYDAEVSDYERRNFIVRKATTGELVLVRAQKGMQWEVEPNRTNEDLGMARVRDVTEGELYSSWSHPQDRPSFYDGKNYT